MLIKEAPSSQHAEYIPVSKLLPGIFCAFSIVRSRMLFYKAKVQLLTILQEIPYSTMDVSAMQNPGSAYSAFSG